jgi:hypothetical protein
MNRADRTGDGNRRTSVGFALQILQRRLASSPAAIYRSLERRRKRLEERLREERLLRDGGSRLARSPVLPSYDPDELEEAPGEEQEAAEEQILDSATAAQTLANLARPFLSAVVAELQRSKGTKVRLTLEIEADAEDGFSEADIGVVRDNARQLKFKTESTGFE